MRNILTLVALVSITVTGCAGPASLAPSAMRATPSPAGMLSVTTAAVAVVTAQPQGEMMPTVAPAVTPEPTAAPTMAPTGVATATPAPQPSPSPSAAPTAAKPAVARLALALPDLGAASEFAGISQWVNSAPLTQASLRGKVVLVDF